jgi:hypothetical protein
MLRCEGTCNVGGFGGTTLEVGEHRRSTVRTGGSCAGTAAWRLLMERRGVRAHPAISTATRGRLMPSVSGPSDNAVRGAGVGRHAAGAVERPNDGTGAVNSTLTAFFFKNLEISAPRCK